MSALLFRAIGAPITGVCIITSLFASIMCPAGQCSCMNPGFARALRHSMHVTCAQATCKIMAAVAGSLANGGVCPITGEQVFTSDVVRRTLAVMQSCGERLLRMPSCCSPERAADCCHSHAYATSLLRRDSVCWSQGCMMPAGSSSVRPPPPCSKTLSFPDPPQLWHCLLRCRHCEASSDIQLIHHGQTCVKCCADQIGLPAKSGVSGIVISVVPNVMGLAAFSPRLDKFGNSVRSAH